MAFLFLLLLIRNSCCLKYHYLDRNCESKWSENYKFIFLSIQSWNRIKHSSMLKKAKADGKFLSCDLHLLIPSI